MSRPARTLALALLLVLPALAVVPATAAPPPESVCQPCREGLEWTAHRYGVALDVTHSTATVRVHRNGSATWTVTSRFEDGVPDRYDDDRSEARDEPLRDPGALSRNGTLRRAVVRATVDSADDSSAETIRLRSATVNESAITVEFLEPTVGRTSLAGVTLGTEYYTDGLGSGWYVDADRVRIVGPPGTTLANDVDAAVGSVGTVEGRNLTLRGSVTDPPALPSRDFFLAFAPTGQWAGPVATLAIWSVTIPRYLGRVLGTQLPGAVALALSLAAVVRLRRRRGERLDRRSVALWAGAATAIYLFLAVGLLPPVDRFRGLALWPLTLVLRIGLALAVGLGSWFGYGAIRTRESAVES